MGMGANSRLVTRAKYLSDHTLENRPSYMGGHVFTCGHYKLCTDHVQMVHENYKCTACNTPGYKLSTFDHDHRRLHA